MGICSPDAVAAGVDCCETMFQEKMNKYREHMVSSDAEFENCPLIYSCYGRINPESHAMVALIAQTAARKRGI